MIEKAKIVKNKDVVKKPSKTLLKVAGVFLGAVIGASSLFTAGLGISQSKYDLPTKQEAIANAQRLNVETTAYRSWVDNLDNTVLSGIKNLVSNDYISRLALPPNGESIKLNIDFPVNEQQKLALTNMCNNINYIFGNGKTDYKFELNFSPTDKDLMNIYNINYKLVKDMGKGVDGKETLGMSTLSHEGVITCFGGTVHVLEKYLQDDSLSNLSEFETTQTHETFHALGFGDAYVQIMAGNLAGDYYSIMRSKNPGHNIQKNDVAILLSNYGNFNDENSAQNIENFVKEYDVNQCLTYAQKELMSATLNKIDNNSIKSIFLNNNIKFNENWELEFNFNESVYYNAAREEFLNGGEVIAPPPLIDSSLNRSLDGKSVFNNLNPQIINKDGILFNTSLNAIVLRVNRYKVQVYCENGLLCGSVSEMCSEKAYQQILESQKQMANENEVTTNITSMENSINDINAESRVSQNKNNNSNNNKTSKEQKNYRFVEEERIL